MIVTVVIGETKSDWFDFELPSNVPVAHLIEMIAGTIEETLSDDDEKFVLEVKTRKGIWRRLDETKTLQDYGIMDGVYLRIQKKHQGEEKHEEIASQLEMLTKEEIRGLLEAWETDG
ncbi:EsaB/YukD family protein [Thermoactinomyces mirandus]|uniref:EsaB/YukD family protein n=1 Tax=Thermoactinomyces mirandus TaxID=2756294 RepID=UPI0028A69709|nr:EsaB/YukD family protein [Thermoactinomyces mirandus]